MNFEEIKQQESQYVMQTYGRFPIVLEKGNGCILEDINGKQYIDLTSGIGVNCLGHNHPEIVKTIQEQASKLMHVSNLYYTTPMIEVAEKLVTSTGLKKVFFANSGAEANEGVIKTARKYSFEKYGEGRATIITLKQSFHGRTMATLTATGQPKFHNYFFPFVDGFKYATANDIEEMKALMDDSVCAVMMELVQGESGVVPLDPKYVKEVEKLCQEKDVLLICDEVQTGVGRTGSLFAFQQYDIKPDLVSVAKGIGGGVPMGAFIAGEKCEYTLKAGDHGTTFGGTPICSAVANTVLSIVNQKEFLDEVVKKGQYFMSEIMKIDSKNIEGVRGMGLMIGIVVDPEKRAGFVSALIEKGLLVLTAGTDAIRLLPPLVISYEEIDQSISIMKEVF